MTRTMITRAGAFVAIGFLLASAVANFMFGLNLGRTRPEGLLIGIVGVFAVAMNALSPFFLSWSWEASRKSVSASVVALWTLCVIYSTTSALGFAAQNREGVTASRQINHDAYEDTRRELLDLEARRDASKGKERQQLDAKIDAARIRLAQARSNGPATADAQASFLSAFTFGLVEPTQIRAALVALFAVMVELGATLGLFVALSPEPQKPAVTLNSWKPKNV